MANDIKLAKIARSLQEAGIDALVMGGHAVRYYGVDRNTSDFDLVTSEESTESLCLRLATIPSLSPLKEIPAWRSGDFARFEIGTLPDGRQELLEFWLRNHLLPDFASMKQRAEVGVYGNENISFISIDDLIRSKETERESDWSDISLLEEIRDARLLSKAKDASGIVTALMNVRSRRGVMALENAGLFRNEELVSQALHLCAHPVSFAILSPIVPSQMAKSDWNIDPTSLAALAKSKFMTPLHFAIIEVIRRGYKRQAMDRDRADKEVMAKKRNP